MTRSATRCLPWPRACAAIAAIILFAVPARAELLQVTLAGTFTTGQFGATLAPPIPFSGSFDIDTTAAAVQTVTVQGQTLTGYAASAISHISVSLFGMPYSTANLVDLIVDNGILVTAYSVPLPDNGDAVYFSTPLAPGASPTITMELNGLYPDVSFPVHAIFDMGALDGVGTVGSMVFDEFIEGFVPAVYDQGPLTVHVTTAAVPEPGPLPVLLAGLGAIALLLRNRQHARTRAIG